MAHPVLEWSPYWNDEFGCTSSLSVFIGKEAVSFVPHKVHYFAKLMNFSQYLFGEELARFEYRKQTLGVDTYCIEQ